MEQVVVLPKPQVQQVVVVERVLHVSTSLQVLPVLQHLATRLVQVEPVTPVLQVVLAEIVFLL